MQATSISNIIRDEAPQIIEEMFQEAAAEARWSAPPLDDDRLKLAEEKLKVAEEKLRIAEDKLKATEEKLKVSEEKARVIRHVNVSLEEDVTKSW